MIRIGEKTAVALLGVLSVSTLVGVYFLRIERQCLQREKLISHTDHYDVSSKNVKE